MAQLKSLMVSGSTELSNAYGTTVHGSDNSRALATTEFVKQAFINNDALRYSGTITPVYDRYNGGTLTPAATPGETFKVTGSGFINGVEVTEGALVICRITTDAAATWNMIAAPSTYDEETVYYRRWIRTADENPVSGIYRVGGWDNLYYYEEINSNNPMYYISANYTYTTATESSSCFYIEVETEQQINVVYINYNASQFHLHKENATDIAVYMNITADNYHTFYTNLFITDDNTDPPSLTNFLTVRDNWDYIVSDMEGTLYKAQAAFEDGKALIADGVNGRVVCSAFELGEACQYPLAYSGYRQDSNNVVSYGVLSDLYQDIDTLEDSVDSISRIIQEKKSAIQYDSITFVTADSFLQIGDEFDVNMFDYVGYISSQEFFNSTKASVLWTKGEDENSYSLATSYTAGTTYYKYINGIFSQDTSITSATAFNNAKVNTLYTWNGSTYDFVQASVWDPEQTYYSAQNESSIVTSLTENTFYNGTYYYKIPRYTLVTSWSASTPCYQRRYWIFGGTGYTPVIYNTSSTRAQQQLICSEAFQYYNRQMTFAHTIQYPNFKFDIDNTIEDAVVNLYRIINGDYNYFDSQDSYINHTINYEQPTGVFRYENDVNNDNAYTGRFILQDIDELQYIIGTYNNLLPTKQGDTNTIINSTIIDQINDINRLLGINSFYGFQAEGGLNIPENDNVISVVNRLLLSDQKNEWLTPNGGNNALTIGKSSIPTYNLLINGDAISINDKSNNTLFSINNIDSSIAGNGAKMLTSVPIYLSKLDVTENDITWKMEVRANGNLSFGLVEE